MTFAEQFKKMLDDCPDMPKRDPAPERPPCSMCRTYGADLNENGLCARCQVDLDRGYTVSAKAGRCANGAERDGGTLFHARLLKKNNTREGYYPQWKPVCGSAPGPRSAGWSEWRPSPDQPVTCTRCLAKLKRMGK